MAWDLKKHEGSSQAGVPWLSELQQLGPRQAPLGKEAPMEILGPALCLFAKLLVAHLPVGLRGWSNLLY